MKSRTDSLDALLRRGLFNIPSYQRAYSWEESQLQDLLDDLRYLPDKTSHFFGNVVLDEKSKEYHTDRGRRLDMYDVVDGQQRLTTAIVLLSVAGEVDEVVRETMEADNLLFPVEERPRLLPQDQDEEYFRDGLLGKASLDPKTPSQRRLKQAQTFYLRQLSDIGSDLSVRELVEKLRYDLTINVVELEDESEAAAIFESLNDRGKDLSTLDKTKSFLMYMDTRSSQKGALESKIKGRFGEIFRELFVFSDGHERVQDFDEGSFQQYHWGLYDGYDTDEYFQELATLKKRLRNLYRDEEHDEIQSIINDYTESLLEASSAFSALFRPSKYEKEVEDELRRLLTLGRVANVLPVLMASHLRWGGENPESMASIIDACETLVFRVYAIDRRRSDTGRGKLVSLAHDIYTGSLEAHSEAVSCILEITETYAPDERFKRDLRDIGFYDSITSRDIRYLLFHYSQNLDAEIQEETGDLSRILSQEFQVEHIQAKNLSEKDLPSSLRGEFDEHVDRLANLTIASKYWNRSYGDLPFRKKKTSGSQGKKSYSSSTIRAQRVLTDISEFGLKQMDQREKEIVDFALERWSLDQQGRI
jgi:uncharacterized protein with ParB-like and HNH nuclease domain